MIASSDPAGGGSFRFDRVKRYEAFSKHAVRPALRCGLTPPGRCLLTPSHNSKAAKNLGHVVSAAAGLGMPLAIRSRTATALERGSLSWPPYLVHMHSTLSYCCWGTRLRGIIVTLVVLLLAGYLAVTFERPRTRSSAQSTSGDVTGQWRRTRSGWELRESWQYPSPTLNPPPIAWRVHPALIAVVQLLTSILALAWSDSGPPTVSERLPSREPKRSSATHRPRYAVYYTSRGTNNSP